MPTVSTVRCLQFACRFAWLRNVVCLTVREERWRCQSRRDWGECLDLGERKGQEAWENCVLEVHELCTLPKTSGWSNQRGKMGEECGAQGRGKNAYGFGSRTEGQRPLWRPTHTREAKLKWVFKIVRNGWTELICLRTGTSGGPLWPQQ